MQPEAERHGFVAPVFQDGGDLQCPGCQPHLQGEQEPERVGLECFVGFAHLQLHATSIRQGFQPPGHMAREAVLAEVEYTLRQGQSVLRQASGDREEHREAATHWLGWVEEALEIEVNNLMAKQRQPLINPPRSGTTRSRSPLTGSLNSHWG